MCIRDRAPDSEVESREEERRREERREEIGAAGEETPSEKDAVTRQAPSTTIPFPLCRASTPAYKESESTAVDVATSRARSYGPTPNQARSALRRKAIGPQTPCSGAAATITSASSDSTAEGPDTASEISF